MTALELNAEVFAAETFDSQIVILNLIEGTYYALGGAAVEAWPLISTGQDLGHVIEELSRVHGVPLDAVEDAVRPFSKILVGEGILRPAAVSAPVRLTALLPAFAAPTFEKHSDMQDLLTLDPIHDVDPEKGWPVV